MLTIIPSSLWKAASPEIPNKLQGDVWKCPPDIHHVLLYKTIITTSDYPHNITIMFKYVHIH